MSKRNYNRRTDEEIISELQNRIKKIEGRLESKQRQDSPVLKEIPKVKRTLAKFSQLCMDHQRNDLANTVMAFLATVENQARELPAELIPVRGRQLIEEEVAAR